VEESKLGRDAAGGRARFLIPHCPSELHPFMSRTAVHKLHVYTLLHKRTLSTTNTLCSCFSTRDLARRAKRRWVSGQLLARASDSVPWPSSAR
jgi:hypothetical protein